MRSDGKLFTGKLGPETRAEKVGVCSEGTALGEVWRRQDARATLAHLPQGGASATVLGGPVPQAAEDAHMTEKARREALTSWPRNG